MQATLERAWSDDMRRYKPRPFIGGKMSGLTSNNQRLVQQDIATILASVNAWTAFHGADWDPFTAHIALPAWDPAVQKCQDVDVLDNNERHLAVSDALVVLAFDDGSAMLGWLLACVLRRAHVVPVVILAHTGTVLSKALLGLKQRFNQLTFSAFTDEAELYQKTQAWIDVAHPDIQEGPNRRRFLEERWRGVQTALLEGWTFALPPVREHITRTTGLRAEWLEELLTEPLMVGDLPGNSLGVLIESLAPSRSLVEIAERLFDATELAAWRHWANDKGHDYAASVLLSATRDRMEENVSRSQYLGQPAAWARYAEQWQRP
jgi:hypothetical protein